MIMNVGVVSLVADKELRFICSKVDKIVLITMAVIMNHGDCLRPVGH